ncbi:MAG: 1-acyl-sn-glycerol-3-phosphate acyltransferase [Firmicutes bacterium]|nr:1-acyl-sn-glycerol-3-phosphate acyltransferase [Bacillota bacterium]
MIIDSDGIKRIERFSEKNFSNPQRKRRKQLKTKKDIFNKNPLRLFFGKILVFLSFLIFSPFIKAKYRLKIENRKALKKIKGKGAVVVMNHSNYSIDGPSLIFQSLPRRCWVTVPEVVATRKLSVIPFPQDLANMRVFKEVINERLELNQLVTFFPEVTPWEYYRSTRPFKSGAFRFAVQNNVPILPIAMCFRIINKKNGRKKYRATMHFFEPIYSNKELTETKAIEELKNNTYVLIQERVEKEREKDV